MLNLPGDALDDFYPLLGRARAALINSGFNFTFGRTTINLAMIARESALDGAVRPVKGVPPISEAQLLGGPPAW